MADPDHDSAATLDPRAAKTLADLIALTLADATPEADAALAAIRRRAARDRITGGALKALLERLRDHDPALAETATQKIARLEWTTADQRQELDQLHRLRHQAEAALSDLRAANASLSDLLAARHRAARRNAVLGTLAGAAIALAAGGATLWATGQPPPGPTPSQADQRLADHLHACFVSSTDSLGGGTPTDLRLHLTITAAGTLAAATLPHPPAAPDARRYADLLLLALSHGCGPLPLPASLRGHPAELDLLLPG